MFLKDEQLTDNQLKKSPDLFKSVKSPWKKKNLDLVWNSVLFLLSVLKN